MSCYNPYKKVKWFHPMVRIRLSGDECIRFIEFARYHQIPVWEITPQENGSYLCLMFWKDVRTLRLQFRKTNTKLKILERRGLPFFYRKQRKKAALYAGLLILMLLYFLFSNWIWCIQISGNETISDEEILTLLEDEKQGFFIPTRKINTKQVVRSIQKTYPEIVWLSCKKNKCFLSITIKEAEETVSKETSDQKAAGIIAARDATITSMITRKGTPVVKIGDYVKKGDLLVDGYTYVYDDFEEMISKHPLKASADIYGKVQYQKQFQVPFEYEVKQEIEPKRVQYELECHNIRVNFPGPPYSFHRAKTSHCLKEESRSKQRYYWEEHGYLPLVITKKTSIFYTTTKKRYTNLQAELVLKDKINDFFIKIGKKGIQVLDKNVMIENNNDFYNATVCYTVNEEIGRLSVNESDRVSR